MDAVKYLTERVRMCNSYEHCTDCVFEGGPCGVGVKKLEDAIEAVAIVEKWSEEHPLVTNGMKVWELIPGYVRSTNSRPAKENALLGQIVESEYIELLVSKSWWDEEYKGEE